MTCDRIQDLILTEYIDGEAKAKVVESVDAHLKDCPVCREFLAAVRRTVVEPFIETPLPAVSQERVWQAVREQIKPEVLEEKAVAPFWERFRQVWGLQPLLAFGCLVLAVAAFQTVSGIQGDMDVATQESETMQMASSDFFDEDEEEVDYDTAIERYFL